MPSLQGRWIYLHRQGPTASMYGAGDGQSKEKTCGFRLFGSIFSSIIWKNYHILEVYNYYFCSVMVHYNYIVLGEWRVTQISKHPGGLFLKLQSCDWNSIVAMIEMHQFNRSIALIQSSDFNLQSSDCINSSIKFQWWNTHDWNDLLSSSLKLTSWLKWWTVSKKDCNCINYFRFESWVGMHSPARTRYTYS